MVSFRNLSIASKMMLLACFSSGVALALSCVGFATYGVHAMRQSKLARLQDRATVLAFYAAPVVTVGDTRAGEQVLESLQSDPTIESARILDRDMNLVAAFGNDQSQRQRGGTDGTLIQQFLDLGQAEVMQPIEVAGQPIGTVFLRANTSDLEARLNQFARIAGYVLAAAMTLALIISARVQRAISRPILSLTEVASRISRDSDYSIRVDAPAGAELQTLQDAFNCMLDQVQQSERELQQAHNKLEERVEARTRELSEEIARRKAIQDDLERAKDAAEAASRAKSEFLANMSHELRTPLNGIVGFTDLLLEDEGCFLHEHHDYLKTIQRSSTHLLELISDILDLSKIEAGRMEVEKIECSAHRVIAEVTSLLRVRAREKGLFLNYEWSTAMPASVRTDPARLRQLVMNLISNAIKFTEQGQITVRAGVDDSPHNPKLKIDVIDSGIGIATDRQAGIFDPFTQADSSVTRRFGGTGLGLAICRKICNALGGDLTLQSGVGQGSTFTARIEIGSLAGKRILADSEFELVDAAHENDLIKVTLPPARILVVDDGDTNRKLIRLLLQRAGAQPSTAENGKQAYEMASRSEFQLILMDMQMPVMDGYTATERLRADGIQVPIIALTVHAMKGDEEKCMDAGCTGYLTKPVDRKRLLTVVAAAVGGEVEPRPAPNANAKRGEQGATREFEHEPLISTLPVDDPEFLQILEEFVERLQQKCAAMEEALENRCGKELADLAHWLKGAGGTAGFDQFTDPARLLEQGARRADYEEAHRQLQVILTLTSRIALQPA